ncbi:hypothetical protein N658DRAFT_359162 [Parathielavia hyrcaniae]|uniref:Uncharacterized protein n=1 Tax=Parathielavia hyrcaniae TaxID=113614 RepID=A0AAN6Q2C0_9PEZI|nr:hypothetical protein N658DRAFT_359162 [Parathielavia hyrcaniae]
MWLPRGRRADGTKLPAHLATSKYLSRESVKLVVAQTRPSGVRAAALPFTVAARFRTHTTFTAGLGFPARRAYLQRSHAINIIVKILVRLWLTGSQGISATNLTNQLEHYLALSRRTPTNIPSPPAATVLKPALSWSHSLEFVCHQLQRRDPASRAPNFLDDLDVTAWPLQVARSLPRCCPLT